jgi:ankyrin repeat protein
MRNLTALAFLLLIFSMPLAAQALLPTEPAVQALMELASRGHLEGVQRVVEAGVSVNSVDTEQRTPLMWAAFEGQTAVARYLLENGAVLDARDSNGRTALLYASSGPFPETVGLLLKQGAEVDQQGKTEGFTALMTAAAEGQLEVVRLLLAYGATTDIKDKDGDTAESFAFQNGHSEVAKLLANPPAPGVRH